MLAAIRHLLARMNVLSESILSAGLGTGQIHKGQIAAGFQDAQNFAESRFLLVAVHVVKHE